MAVRTGLEPATSCVTGRHSNQLNYRTKLRGQDLNLRPSGYEPDELPDCSTPHQEAAHCTSRRVARQSLIDVRSARAARAISGTSVPISQQVGLARLQPITSGCIWEFSLGQTMHYRCTHFRNGSSALTA